MQTNLNLF